MKRGLKKIIRPELQLEANGLAGRLLLPLFALYVYIKCVRVVKIDLMAGEHRLGIYKALILPKIEVV